jgi:hypothetical protein
MIRTKETPVYWCCPIFRSPGSVLESSCSDVILPAFLSR